MPTCTHTLRVVSGSHRATAESAGLLREAGGLDALRKATTLFYRRMFADGHLDKFIRSHDDPHGERFATWVAEKLGVGNPWSDARAARPVCPVSAGQYGTITVHDRSSAHLAAWHSPKREREKFGDHFKLDDCRRWMRLHFWACRESGIFAHKGFEDYYVRFLAHFVSVYEQKAPPFARESARWSLDSANTQAYLDAGNEMTDGIMGMPLHAALATLPPHERNYTGSVVANPSWPYGPT